MSENRKRNVALLVGGAIALWLLLGNRANAATSTPKPRDIPGGRWQVDPVTGGWRWVADSAAGALPTGPGDNGGIGPGAGASTPWCESCSGGSAAPDRTILEPRLIPRITEDEIAPPTPIWAFPGDEPRPSVLPPVAMPTPVVATPVAPPVAPPPVYVAPPARPVIAPVAPPPVYVAAGIGPYTVNPVSGQIQAFAPPGMQWIASNEGGSASDGYYAPVQDSFYSGN
jgi:hypothetical protein